ncbi:MAG TPA: hypothetical protein VGG57_05690 [Stellaceae bacterium]
MRRTAAGFAALLVLACVPLFSTVLPPLVDLPNHLARMHLLAEGGNQYYAVHWAPLPNLAADAVIPLLARVMPLMLAGKIFLILIFALIAGGVVWLNRIVAGRWRLWPLLAFLFLYNRIFLWGFVNDLFGLGMALCGLALWLELELRPTALRIAASCLVALACFFSHLVGFGVYALAIAGVELVPGWIELRRRQWALLAGRVGVAALQFVIPAVVFLAWWEPGAGQTVSYAGFWRKFDLLFSVFDNYSRPFDVACFVLMALAPIMLAVTRRLNLAPRMAGALGLVFLAYLLLPSDLLSGTGADHRLPPALFLLLIAGSAPQLGRREAVLAAGAAAVLFAVRLGVVESAWLRADKAYTADLAVLDHLPRGAKLAVAYPAGEENVVAIPLLHLPTLAAARREAFVPTVFAEPAQQPIVLTPEAAALAPLSIAPAWWLTFVDHDPVTRNLLGPALAQYGYIVFLDRKPFDLPPFACLEKIAAEPRFQLVAIRPGCR